MFRLFIAVILFALPVRADMTAQDARFKKLPAGREVCPPRALEGMALALGKTNPHGVAEHVEVQGAPGFEKAMRMTTRKAQENPWGFQSQAKCAVAVKKGDVLLAIFFARAVVASEEAGDVCF